MWVLGVGVGNFFDFIDNIAEWENEKQRVFIV